MQKEQTKEKIRVFALARELDMESKDLLAMCRANGIDVKNQLSTVEPEVREQIESLVKRGSGASAAAKPGGQVLPPKTKEIRNLDSGRSRTPPASRSQTPPVVEEPAAPPAAVLPEVSAPTPIQVPPPAAMPPSVAAEATPAPIVPPTPATPPAPIAPTVVATPPVAPAAPTPPVAVEPPAAPVQPAAPPPAAPTAKPREAAPLPPAAAASQPPARESAQVPPRETPVVAPPAPTPPVGPSRLPTGTVGGRPLRDLDAPRPADGGSGRGAPPAGSRRPGGPTFARRTPTPGGGRGSGAHGKPGAAPPPKKPAEPTGPKKLVSFDPSMLEKKTGPLTAADLVRPKTEEVAPPATTDDDADGKGKDGKSKKPREVPGRDARQKARGARTEERKKKAAVVGAGGRVIIEDDERQRGGRRPKLKQKKQAIKQRQQRVSVDVPITVRALCEALGIKSGDLLFRLMNQGIGKPTINTTLDAATAELVALEYGVELEVKRPADIEEQVLAEQQKPDNPEDLVPRAPIVTIMGHVDHGKTSLLDRLRQQYGVKSDVVSTEAGGITQVIRAWRVEKDGKPVTFLDTPGHEAFTKMRARGANVTDIAVIVVAADDGVMPQTEEAISHAKAAGVSLVVAINKVDMPSANIARTRQQLYGLNVLPDNMGGDTPFVETSAATGKGVDELLEAISLVAELKELRANPKRPARGTCLEAKLTEGEGVQATLLIQNGTLHRGDVVVCGAAFGRVRQMYNDMGQPIQEAGPSVPVRITGLDEVPDADDQFLALEDLADARTIALKRKARKVEAGLVRRSPLTLDQLTEHKIAELKVILKADFRGSVEAIRKELEKLQHEEVRVRILEAGIGAITENDVWLALTSPNDTLIVGFNAVPDDRARALAEERGVKILQYDIIYNLTNDIRAALEGKLKPREEVVYLGRAVVRETFKISRVGTVAGCFVTNGVIERSAKIRLIRSGVVVYPPADRTASLDSLKRFKEDVREVREGFECGMKIAGYDDIKVGDLIEAYRVEEVKRTL